MFSASPIDVVFDARSEKGARTVGGRASSRPPRWIAMERCGCEGPQPSGANTPRPAALRYDPRVKQIIEDVVRWLEAGEPVAVATLVGVIGSGPRQPGACLAVNGRREVVGSLSGGCVESAVVGEAHRVALSGERQILQFSSDADETFTVALTCGASIDVLVEPIRAAGPAAQGFTPEMAKALAGAFARDAPFAICTVVSGGHAGAKLLVPAHESDAATGGLGDAELDRVVARDARGLVDHGGTALRHYGPCGQPGLDDVAVFVDVCAAPPELLVFGAQDFTRALARIAKILGYRVTVVDPRAVFATAARFPEADEVRVDWPQDFLARRVLDERDAVVVLSHDPRIDVPALAGGLRSKASYVGAMGSRKTHAKRVARLREAGIGEADIARIASPIGLDIGARTPEETAISILAEVIALRTGRDGARLRDRSGPIH